MRIIARYITKEIFWAFAVITAILFLIILSNRFAAYLAKAATGELPVGLVFKIVGLYTPELLSYLIPLGLFVGLLFALGRLYADSEMTILSACGISSRYIIQLTLIFSFFVMLLTTLLTLWVVPEITALREKALSEGESLGLMQSMLPQRFQMFSGGKLVFYLEDTSSKEDKLEGIFIAERPMNIANTEDPWTLITAEDARFKRDEKTNQSYIVLKDGHRYQGLPGTADYKVVRFKEYGRTISDETAVTESDTLRLKNTKLLLKSHNAEDIAEFQWRLSLPLSVPILALIAVPLARVRPRHGRFAKFLPAIAIYIIYYNLFTVSRRWVAASILPSFIGVWWVHGLFFLVGLGLIAKDSGWYVRRKAQI
jgi:lipopolysaccharide export system permease protein